MYETQKIKQGLYNAHIWQTFMQLTFFLWLYDSVLLSPYTQTNQAKQISAEMEKERTTSLKIG